jgi:hypothetical protein
MIVLFQLLQRRSISTFLLIKIPSLWGNHLDLDLEKNGCSSPLFFLPYYSNSFYSFGEIWEWMTWALVFLPFHKVQWFEFSTEIRWSESSWAITLGCLYLERDLLGSWNPRRLVDLLWCCDLGGNYLGAPIVVEFSSNLWLSMEFTWEPPIKFSSSPKLIQWVQWPPSRVL